MDNDQLKYWIALKWVEGIGDVSFKTLVDAFGSPQRVFDAPSQMVQAISGMGVKTARQIKSFNDWGRVEIELEKLRQFGAAIITFQEPTYPKSLSRIYDFPPFLYVRGTLKEDDINVAVVGSRAASTYGKYATENLCREMALRGITVVSGLARGIDSSAHRGALAGRGRTIAVLGCGLDVTYPPENRMLYEDIALHGAVITEFPFGTPPSGPNFPARNRIISGISFGVVVVEASEKSGSLITARLALEQGREVFAVPGSIDSAGSKGTNRLIKEGAKLIESADDIIDEILPQLDVPKQNIVPQEPRQKKDTKSRAEKNPPPTFPEISQQERSVAALMTSQPAAVDQLIALSGMKASEVLSCLMTLELKGLIRQLPGKMFLLKE